jgi:cytochrome d ubiquinol oxidase subunit I
MTQLLAGRAQMGTSLGFHIVFASLGMGLPVLIAAAQFLGLRNDDEVWLRLASRLTRAFAVLVVVGVISGIVISVELVLLWPRFVAAAGPVIGLPFSLESYAFLVEAIFLALYLFGRGRLRPWLHWMTLIPVCLGALASAWIVVAANAWMNTPVGFTFAHGRFTHPHPYAAIFNPSMPAETFHMATAAYVATGLTVAGIYAVPVLRGCGGSYERRGLALGMTLAAAFVVPLGIAGDVSGRAIAKHQPLKLAAAEALPATQREAPFTVGGIADGAGHVRYGIQVPYALSLLVGRSPRARVTGLAAAPAKDRPPVEVVHAAFDLMVAIGTLLPIVIGGYFFGHWRRPTWLERPRLLLPVIASGPLAFVAIEAGWTVTEVGRQPWIVYGLVRTSTTLTTSPLIGLMFLLFAALYVTLAAVTVAALRSQRHLLPRRARLAHRSVVDS